MNLSNVLHDYQKLAVQFIKDNPYCGLFLKMGFGKTLITLATLSELKKEGKLNQGHILVIAPKAITKLTWANEIKKWDIPFELVSLIEEYDPKKKKMKDISISKSISIYKELIDDNTSTKIILINRDRIATFLERLTEEKIVWICPYIVIDESQSFKNASSLRFKALKKLKLQTEIKRIILLTGTPTPNGNMDLWSQIFLLDSGYRLGDTITKYRDYYFKKQEIANSIFKYIDLKEKEPLLYDRTKDITMSLDEKDARTINMPSAIFNVIPFDLDEKSQAFYDSLEDACSLILNQNTELSVSTQASLCLKLLQIANGFIYDSLEDTSSVEYASYIEELNILQSKYLANPDNNLTFDRVENVNVQPYFKLHDTKVQILANVIESSNLPAIIYYNFKADKDIILSELPKYLDIKEVPVFDSSQEMLKKWNNKEYKIMLVNPHSQGHGLNFQAGGSTIIWYSLGYNLETFEQANARLIRQGQKSNTVVIHILQASNTIENKVYEKLKSKKKKLDNFLDLIKRTPRKEVKECNIQMLKTK